jgi:hypothetical protein
MTDSTQLASQSEPVEQLMALFGGNLHLQAVMAAVELEIADHLAHGPLSLEELAGRTKTHTPTLLRLVRALESIGIFKRISGDVVGNTPTSDLLRRDLPGSLWSVFRAPFVCGWYQAWMGFPESIRTGQVAFEKIHGCSLWAYQQQDSKRAATFDESMRSMQASMTPAVTAAYDWRQFATIADIGGGVGGQLVDILNAHPCGKGILFDLPDVIGRAIPHDRIERVAGSFFESVPAGADGYVLRSVIHDWADAESVAILKAVRAAAKADSRIILIELAIPETPEYSHSKWSDLTMLTLTGGQERTASEYQQLLQGASLEVEQIVATAVGPSLIVSRPRAT